MSQADPFQGVRAYEDPATLYKKSLRYKGGRFSIFMLDRKWTWIDEAYDAHDAADIADYVCNQGYKTRVEWETFEREESVTFEPYDTDEIRRELRGEP